VIGIALWIDCRLIKLTEIDAVKMNLPQAMEES
jgi:hypothetical protein